MILRLVPVFLGVLLLGTSAATAGPEASEEAERLFESKIRPLLVERCYKCHSGTMSKGGLQVDSLAGILRGGESGAAIVVGKPEESLLLEAVRQQNGLAMPPDGKLNEGQIAALTQWIHAGAPWPGTGAAALTVAALDAMGPTPPNDVELRSGLELWLRSDSLPLADQEMVYVWPDESGHGRDVSATRGVRVGGVGLPAQFVRQSTLLKRPAVRFEATTGLASSPNNPVEIHRDAAFTILLVVNPQRDAEPQALDAIMAIGDPIPATDPGRPLAAMVQFSRGADDALRLAGGFNHDASLGPGSFETHYGQPVLITIVKQPGSMRSTTHIFINGQAVEKPDGEPLDGTDGVPDIQHRADVGVVVGKALSESGRFRGDLGEVVVYSRALTDGQRLGVESYLAEKFGLLLTPLQDATPRVEFTSEEKSFWAYQPLVDRNPPAVRREDWIQTPIDRFVLEQLEARGLDPAPPADKPTLLRRVTFDLIGLPPAPDEVAAFLADDSPQAYEKTVDRLLASPHYGERWARHWLDVVRYAETTGNDSNAVMRFAWRYRNYVIDAFNHDLPYDQFLIEQLAGDLLPPAGSAAIDTRRIIATGYLMVGPKAIAETDKEQLRLDVIDDQIDVTGRTMLGLTLGCARCHDHKFDAIRTADYYALAGILRGTEPFQNEKRNATMWWEYPLPQSGADEPITVMAPKDDMPRNLRIHLRGNRFTLGPIVPRGMLAVVDQLAPRADDRQLRRINPNQPTSGRLELARWIASPANPLTARVMANRIWQHHFGRGLVATTDNFGMRGERPSHPELLDWLALRFVAEGWSVKALHRSILLSNTYRQSGFAGAASPQRDPERRWLSSFTRRRLSAEELRDAMLAVSGQLDRGPGSNESGEYLMSKAENIDPLVKPNRVAADDPFYTTFRKRSIYLPIVRNLLPDVLALFDAADPNGVTAQRGETTVATQTLFLLNSPFVREQAGALAGQLMADDSLSESGRVDRAHRMVLGRAASAEEQVEAREFLAGYLQKFPIGDRPVPVRQLAAWQSYCQTLLCANEFLYVE